MGRQAWVLTCTALAAVSLGGCAGMEGAAPETRAARPLSGREQAFARDLDAFVNATMARFPAVPAFSVAVADSRGPIFVRGYGRADVEANRPATPNTLFYIASSTKSFVALAFALLDARGTIDLDWTLAELAPGVAFRPEIRAGEITLRHMLTHTHGFENEAFAYRVAYTGEHDADTLWRLLPRLEPNNEAPLGTFDYGNIGYNVAALLIERRLDRSWQEIVETEVLRPLGLGQTLVRGIAGARQRGLVAAPYDSIKADAPERLYLQKEDDMLQSAGGMFSSANDLARWLSINLAAFRGDRTPLPAAILAGTHRPAASLDANFASFRRTHYGLGWYSGPYDGATLVHSFGGFAGARSHVSFIPERDLGVAVVTNGEGIGATLTDVIAVYVYQYFSAGRESAEATARAATEALAQRAEQARAGIAADLARRAGRTWQLTLPPSAYAGRYCSDDYGTLRVGERDGRLDVALGRLRARLDPFTEQNTARMELEPGEGRVLRFRVENGAVVAAQSDDTVFRRCG